MRLLDERGKPFDLEAPGTPAFMELVTAYGAMRLPLREDGARVVIAMRAMQALAAKDLATLAEMRVAEAKLPARKGGA